MKKKQSRKRKIIAKIGFFVFTAFLVAVIALAITAFSLIRDLPDPERISERAIAESTKIYDRTGKILLYEVHGEEKRTVIPFDQIPQNVIDATLVAEDVRFYQHAGVDWRAIARAVVINLRHGNLTQGQGASTITQQLVKNSLIGSERTLTRKIREQMLAILLERKYSKDEILGFYLNQIPYGSNSYGISSASETFFGKPAGELKLEEAALLAALPKAPSYFSPRGSHLDKLVNRRNWILNRMADVGFATKEQVIDASEQPITVVAAQQGLTAPHFIEYVREYLKEKYGEESIERGGFRVITTLDVDLQREAEKVVQEGAEQNEKVAHGANAGLVAMNPKTGEILAMVGSRDYFAKPKPDGCKPGINCAFDPSVNITTRLRQPGSAFKPFVYATAFRKGFLPETVLFDVPTEFNASCNGDGTPGPFVRDPKTCYHPQNYDEKFRGPVTLRQSLAQSLNVPSVKLLYLTGIKDSIATARRFGISTLNDPDRYGLSLVLGGAEVTLLDMTSAYGAFAQDGVLHQKIAILRIENASGEILEEKKETSDPVMDTEASRMVTSILSDNNARQPIFSPASALFIPGRAVAAKTGTTQDLRDAWTIGYTPSLVIGVWVGNSNNAPMRKAGVLVAAPIWRKLMDYVLSKTPPEDFIPPETHTSEKPAFRGSYRAGPMVKIDTISKKLATEYTPPDLIEEVGTGPIQSILAFVDPEDPLGHSPANPSQNPQYAHWQTAIDRWLATNSIPALSLPTETDDLHTPEKIPRISLLFTSPDLNRLVDVQSIAMDVASVFPLREVFLFVDNELVDSKTAPILAPHIFFPLLKPLSPGPHHIKITAYDAVENQSSQEQMITVVPE